jgi:hypothetical protein
VLPGRKELIDIAEGLNPSLSTIRSLPFMEALGLDFQRLGISKNNSALESF